MMGNSNSVVTKFDKEDFKLTNDNQTERIPTKRQADQVKNSSDYEKLIMKEYFESQTLVINQLKEEVKKLRDANLKLEQRVKKLEEKSNSHASSPNNGVIVQSFDNFSTRLARNHDDLINLTQPRDSASNKSEIFKLKLAQDAAANDSKNHDWDDHKLSDDRIIIIDTDTTTRSDSLVPSKSFNFKKRDSHAKVQAFLAESNGNNNSKNKLVPDNSKALVAARGGRDMKRISINLDQVDVIGVNTNETVKINEKRNSIANKDLNMMENSSYYGIRNEKLVKILHK